ncbi:MAG TPA: hypothetical protein VK550_27255 [Polyangiaceae bacterium]|nr:hypothetical protein [Polyangiaceae bacterium]
MTDENSVLDPDIAELLDRATPYPDEPIEVRSRVREALKARLAANAADSVTDQRPNPDARSAPRPAASPAGSFIPIAWAVRPGWRLAATFIVGTATGASLHAVLRPPHERIVYVERAPASQTRPTAEALTLPPAPPPATSAAVANDTVPPLARPLPPDKSTPPISDLVAEQQLLDVARAALSRGRADDALAPLDRHSQRYPKGILAEEREALAINVLVTLGRYEEARDRSARFLQRYPDSLLRGSVEAARAAIP